VNKNIAAGGFWFCFSTVGSYGFFDGNYDGLAIEIRPMIAIDVTSIPV